MLLAEHFVRSPQWEWFILGYFFLAGLTGGSYALATMLRLLGGPDNEAAARVGFYVAFVAVVPCPILLTVDLGQPFRFWHMIVNTTPGALALNVKYWSPMSLGVWALLVYGAIVTVSFLEVLIKDEVIRNRGLAAGLARLLDRAIGRAFSVVGSVLALFIASYTGVLLSVSNQPIWSDTWSLGGLFLASGLSGSAALITLLVRRRPEAAASDERLRRADGYFALLEVALIALFLISLTLAGTLGQALELPWTLLWLLVLASLVPPLAGLVGGPPAVAGAGVHGGQLAARRPAVAAASVPLLVLVGVLALRAAVIFSAQT